MIKKTISCLLIYLLSASAFAGITIKYKYDNNEPVELNDLKDNIIIDGQNDGLTLKASNNTSNYILVTIKPKTGKHFENKYYRNAKHHVTIINPELNVSVDHWGWSEAEGMFVIREISYDTNGKINKLALDLLNHSLLYNNQYGSTVFATIRFNSDVAMDFDKFIIYPEGPKHQVNIFDGHDLKKLTADSVEEFYHLNPTMFIDENKELELKYDDKNGNYYDLHFCAGEGNELSVNKYSRVSSCPSNNNEGGMYFSIKGSAFVSQESDFDVREFERDENGKIKSFAIDFEYHGGERQDVSYGALRYNSYVPVEMFPACKFDYKEQIINVPYAKYTSDHGNSMYKLKLRLVDRFTMTFILDDFNWVEDVPKNIIAAATFNRYDRSLTLPAVQVEDFKNGTKEYSLKLITKSERLEKGAIFKLQNDYYSAKTAIFHSLNKRK